MTLHVALVLRLLGVGATDGGGGLGTFDSRAGVGIWDWQCCTAHPARRPAQKCPFSKENWLGCQAPGHKTDLRGVPPVGTPRSTRRQTLPRDWQTAALAPMIVHRGRGKPPGHHHMTWVGGVSSFPSSRALLPDWPAPAPGPGLHRPRGGPAAVARQPAVGPGHRCPGWGCG